MSIVNPSAATGGERDRKAEHLRLAVAPGTLHADGTGLDAVRLRHRALPERDLEDVSLRTDLLGRTLEAPLVISAMTGGTAVAATINARLARAACRHGVGMALGSGRRLVEDPGLLGTYRAEHRPPLLLANLGAAQLRGPQGPATAERLVELLEVDGLTVHLNPLQEAIQAEGEPRFTAVADAIAAVTRRIAPLRVVAKEVGFGLDPADVTLLREAGVAGIDVAGSGGTNWALVEGRRDPRAGELAQAFARWGLPTAEALVEARRAAPDLPLIGSGGLRDGVDAAKCLALGATAAGFARTLLAAAESDRASEALGLLVEQLRIAAWAAGAPSAAGLGSEHLREGPS